MTMPRVTLYEIADLKGLIDEALEESGGELTPEIEASLNEWDEKFADKAERVALYICEVESKADACRTAAKNLTTRAASFDRRVDSLKQYLLNQMEKVGKTKIEGVLKTVAIQKNPPSVVGELDGMALDDLDTACSPFVRVVPRSVSLDRRAILEAHKAGQAIPSGLTITQTTGLRIR